MAKRIVILGSTGSIGDTAFKVLRSLGRGYRVVGLAAGSQVGKLSMQVRAWAPRCVGVAAADEADLLRRRLQGVEVVAGSKGLVDLATMDEADIVLNALVGAVGLEPTVAALEAGKVVAMANKEPLVMAGGLILEKARQCGGTLLPLDSEPNALWQCLKGERSGDVQRLILTASGGPFFGCTRAQMGAVTPEQALNHPTWKMGPKITVDSATLMNKGFEVIEASWLFGVGIEQVEVVIHRESTVHSMVEFVDGSILAHLGRTDMHLPIQYALTHPERRPTDLETLDLLELGTLSFAAPDWESFPCLDLCCQAGRAGGVVPAALNAANEVTVAAFLAGEIGFLDIAAINRSVVEACEPLPADSLETVLEADRWARARAREWTSRAAVKN